LFSRSDQCCVAAELAEAGACAAGKRYTSDGSAWGRIEHALISEMPAAKRARRVSFMA
jgi:hypothetical protein